MENKSGSSLMQVPEEVVNLIGTMRIENHLLNKQMHAMEEKVKKIEAKLLELDNASKPVELVTSTPETAPTNE